MPSNLVKPIIIIGCPRSGTTLLYSILSSSPELQSLHNESRFLFRSFYKKKLDIGISFASDLLRVNDLDDEDIRYFRKEFLKYSFSSKLLAKSIHKVFRKLWFLKPIEFFMVEINFLVKNIFSTKHRLIEKTPRNCFKIEMMNKLFPDAFFIFIKRDPQTNISSLIDAWSHRKSSKRISKRLPAIRYKLNIKGYDGADWKFALPPGYESVVNSPIEEVCAFQWQKSNEEALKGLERIPENRKIEISYEDLVSNTSNVIKSICTFTEIEYKGDSARLAENPPTVNYIKEKPSPEKWKKNQDLIARVVPRLEMISEKLGYKSYN
jgi:Sulfotransferase family